MNCWHCDRPAHGTCRFCGRGLCREHAQSMPHITDLYRTQKGEYRALVVGDTLYCGICQPKEDPVKIEGLE
ncbi:MAG: hypothetical protein JW850_16315 [Thermoflexales bacterium]|nr:hypothetical protein [Thermoflexales bacterium]